MYSMLFNCFRWLLHLSYRIPRIVPPGSAANWAPQRQWINSSNAERFAGLSLYILEGRLMYDYNFLGQRHYTLTYADPVPAGNSTLSFAFNKTGPYQGEGGLFVNGSEVGNVTMPRVVMRRYSFEEGLEVGEDPQTPVTDSYMSPFSFTGKLEKVVMEVEG